MADNFLKRGFRLANIVMAGKKISAMNNEYERAIAKRALANQFADARGAVMKIGQFLASSETENTFESLLKGIDAIPLVSIVSLIEQELGQQIDHVFSSIKESNAAASLGQVHRAILLNGEEVAVKIQYPTIAETVSSEIKLFGLMPGFGPVKKWGFDLESYKESFKQNMDRELDYQVEAENQLRFKQQVNIEGLIVPEIYAEYIKPKLIVQSWEQGVYINEINHWSIQDRKKVGEILLATLFKSLFEVGLVHADPHKGNSYFRYSEQQQPEVVLMDYGCMVEITEIQRLALLKLILSCSEQIDNSPLRYFAALGFDADKLAKIGDTLPMLCQILFKPFKEPALFHINHWQLESRFNQLLEERRWWFRSAGPSQLFLVMRAFQGVVQQLESLKVSLSWSQILHLSVSKDTLDKARALELPQLPQEHSLITTSLSALAKSLRISVTRQGKQSVDVTLPAEMVLELENLMPEDVLEKLQNSQTIDFNQILKNIKESGIARQTVFSFTEKDKKYAVWLE